MLAGGRTPGHPRGTDTDFGGRVHKLNEGELYWIDRRIPPILALKAQFKDGSQTCTAADVARCSLAIQGWEAASGTSHVPLESTVEALKLSGRKTGERLSVKGSFAL